MKIKSPLSHKKEVIPLCKAGADEFFCGVEPHSWRKKYKDFCINQRSGGVNFSKLSDLEEAIRIAHKYKTKVHITMNGFFYLEEQYEAAGRIIKDVLGAGADGIIFADPGLLLFTDKSLLKHKDVIAGCDTVIFNSSAAQFYKKLGVTRVVIPRSMTTGEISEVLSSDRALEYEVFIIHDLCFFEDGFCTYCKEGSGGIKKEGRGRDKIHLFSSSRLPGRGYAGGCRTKFIRHKISLAQNKELKAGKNFTFWGKKHIEGCGACAMYDFKKMGVDSLKVLDRNMPTEEKVKATAFIKKSLNLLENSNIVKAEYVDKCKKLFKETFKTSCSLYDCYYLSAGIMKN